MMKTIFVPKAFDCENSVVRLVKESELAFDQRLDEVAHAISTACVEEGVRIIRLSGPSCSGKTTTAAKLEDTLQAAGCAVYPISLDDFFYNRDVLHEKAQQHPEGKLDYDSVEALDLDTLRSCVHDLMTYGKSEMPIFDFTTGDREGRRLLDTTQYPDKPPVFLFEGIQAVYPRVVDMMDGVPDRSVFISVESSLWVGDEGFLPHEIRLMRRLVRDEAKRGATPTFTLSLWHSVRANEEASILPHAVDCDITIDSAMAFDVHMLAPHLRKILSEQPVTGEDAETARQLLARIEGVQGISDKYLAPNSLYHEFILR